jgi:hypothetical protein
MTILVALLFLSFVDKNFNDAHYNHAAADMFVQIARSFD